MMRKKRMKWIPICISFIMILLVVVPGRATTISDLEKQKQEIEKQKEEANQKKLEEQKKLDSANNQVS